MFWYISISISISIILLAVFGYCLFSIGKQADEDIEKLIKVLNGLPKNKK